MAMSKEDQKAASDRIVAKEPLTKQERQAYNLLSKQPDEYVLPDPENGVRVCGVCGAEFQGAGTTKEGRAMSALEEFSNHMADHNSTPAQWTEAHRRIQAGRERAKSKESLSA
jgi:hypothetical protein